MILELKYLPSEDRKIAVIYVEGLIKLSESPEFFTWAARLPSIGGNVVVDFNKIDYIDSTGFGELVGVCVSLVRAGLNIVLSKSPDRTVPPVIDRKIARLLRIANATNDLRVFENEQDAIAAVAAGIPEKVAPASPDLADNKITETVSYVENPPQN